MLLNCVCNDTQKKQNFSTSSLSQTFALKDGLCLGTVALTVLGLGFGQLALVLSGRGSAAVAMWYGAGLATQRAIPPGSVNEYQPKLGSKRAYHAMHWPRIRGLAASAKETEISAAP